MEVIETFQNQQQRIYVVGFNRGFTKELVFLALQLPVFLNLI